MTHICVSKLTIIGSDNGLSPGRRQAIIWTNAEILLIGPLGTKFSEILIEIHTFSFKKMFLNMSSGKCRPFCLGLNVLNCFADFVTNGLPSNIPQLKNKLISVDIMDYCANIPNGRSDIICMMIISGPLILFRDCISCNCFISCAQNAFQLYRQISHLLNGIPN